MTLLTQFYDKPFQVWTTEGNQLVLPPKYFDEVKMLPDHTFPSSLRDVRNMRRMSILITDYRSLVHAAGTHDGAFATMEARLCEFRHQA